MNYKLSKREKTLMYILLLLIIVLVGWFLLLEPSLSEYTEKQSQLSENKIKLNGLKSTYADYEDAPTKALDESAKYITNKEKFYKAMTNEDIDKLLTRMALLHSLKPVNLNIGEISAADEIVSYDDSLDKEETTKTESTTGTEKTILVNKVEVSMSLAGEINNAFALADEIKDNSALRLKSYSYIKGETTLKSSMILVFDVYMINE
ncbi:MAG: hypothetical protein PHQ89_04125 [Bacilli bacterium]|nr:hypothetical protein [Bacilli bacterium]